MYNDFSTEENTKRLEEASKELNFRLVNLSDITTHPSPNYLLVLQRSQQEAIADDAGLLIVESDVVVKRTPYRICTTEQQHVADVPLQQP